MQKTPPGIGPHHHQHQVSHAQLASAAAPNTPLSAHDNYSRQCTMTTHTFVHDELHALYPSQHYTHDCAQWRLTVVDDEPHTLYPSQHQVVHEKAGCHVAPVGLCVYTPELYGSHRET
eukprot:1159827-Pelagomonas_calceolata.AAC.14